MIFPVFTKKNVNLHKASSGNLNVTVVTSIRGVYHRWRYNPNADLGFETSVRPTVFKTEQKEMKCAEIYTTLSKHVKTTLLELLKVELKSHFFFLSWVHRGQNLSSRQAKG